ncbi:TetR family transcriptional regulator [Nocardia arthritidis]|uniref:TetR family transcriptional regulator n=1 Tax=Nocardia arthritidis TaxID=228602 RepID=A0A6G9Y930_9NOCA|nr:TetR family transcriptional regulator [Nocardia arthritidis]QIS09630.1 TetR family transcriptional regulator [Nocardia arthritidis]
MTDRRGRLLDRLAEAIADGGIEGVSIRDLAARAQVSIGTVQYYFGTKADLLTAAWQHMRDQADARLRRSGIADLEPGEMLFGLAEFLLPPTQEDRLSRVWLALVARAAHDRRIAEVHREQWRETEDLLARVLARANPAAKPNHAMPQRNCSRCWTGWPSRCSPSPRGSRPNGPGASPAAGSAPGSAEPGQCSKMPSRMLGGNPMINCDTCLRTWPTRSSVGSDCHTRRISSRA